MIKIKINEFKVKGYDASKVRDDQLRDDWRLLCAKYSVMKKGGKTEFAKIEDLIEFAEKVMREMLKRKIIVFHPDKMKKSSLELLKKILNRIGKKLSDVTESLKLKNEKDVVYIPDFVCQIGSSVKKDNYEDIDILFRRPPRDPSLEVLIAKTLGRQNKDYHWVYNPEGPHDDYVPLFDLVLRAKDKGIVKVNENRNGNEEKKVIKLNLGCGDNKLPGFVNIDITGHPDLYWDLEHGIPFPNDSVDYVLAKHSLEHLSNHFFIMSEIWRVLKPGGIFEFEFPSTKGQGAFGNPTHKSLWNAVTIQFFCEDNLRKSHFIYPKFEIEKLEEYDDPEWDVVYLVGKLRCVKNSGIDEVLESKNLKPLQIFTPLKTSSGYTMQEYYDIKTFVDKWADAYLKRGKKIDTEIKYNGWRTVLQKDNGNTLIYFEDSKRDRSNQFPDLVADLKVIDKPVILDAELGAIGPGGKVIARKDLAYWGTTKDKVYRKFETPAGVKGTLVCHVFDCLYYDDKDLHNEPWTTRREQLENIFAKYDFKIFKLSPKNISDNKADLIKDIQKVSKVEGSEGAVCKVTDSTYPLTGQTPAWAKIKTIVEFKVQVIKRNPVKGTTNVFNYTVGYLSKGKLETLGKTFNTTVKANPGDILTITAQEIIPKFKDGRWLIGAVVPAVRDIELARKNPETAEEIIKRAYAAGILQISPDVRDELKKSKLISSSESFAIIEAKKEGEAGERGNITITKGMKGDGVLQLHIMGLTEDGVKKIMRNSLRIMAAVRKGLKPFRDIMQSLISAGCHIDLRLHPSGMNYWEGGEILIGNIKGLDKLADYKPGDSLRFMWKQPRKGEGEAEVIRGPLSWLDFGKKSPAIFEPGEVGAFSKSYAVMIIIDFIDWKAHKQEEHIKEFEFNFTRNKNLSGRWLFMYAPIADGKRIWIAKRPKDQTFFKDE
ncbi:MAG: hypothetical protein DRP74_00730 [Candidatus Omnitrophota bacterium]|nr:MAG: hypothetical protein DRP74_00730 [Candidatus Omnitrophota bacterium]